MGTEEQAKKLMRVSKMEFSTFVQKKLYKCPVCNGRGLVPAGFYRDGGYSTYYVAGEQVCRACGGQGVIWSRDAEISDPEER